MSFVEFNVDLKYVGKQLRRIADVLETLVPLPTEATELKPEEAVTYTDDEQIAMAEQEEAIRKLENELAERYAQEDAGQEGFGQGDIPSTHRK